MLFAARGTLEARVALYRHLRAQSTHWSKGRAAHTDRAGPIVRSVHSAGLRLLLRMEYLLSSGLDADISATSAARMSADAWEARVGGGYAQWEAARLDQLEREDDPRWRAAIGTGAGLEGRRRLAAARGSSASDGGGGSNGGGGDGSGSGSGSSGGACGSGVRRGGRGKQGSAERGGGANVRDVTPHDIAHQS